jgi:Uma2 family endonuclease
MSLTCQAPPLRARSLALFATLIDRTTKRQLYARHGVPFCWLVDPEGRANEALGLGPDEYELAARASGAEPVSLSPFPDPPLVLATLWP